MSMMLSACQTHSTLQPFTSDGCSMFPDRALSQAIDWCSCCLAHDLAYWQGGSAQERMKADRELAECVTAAAHGSALAGIMLAGVRVGGHASLPTSYRWGYGWPYGRLYRPLSTHEQSQANSLRAAYLATNPGLACPGPGAGTLLQTVTHW